MEEKAQAPQKSEFWCNFCGFKTADEKVYLAHSCSDELGRAGKTPDPSKRSNHCN